ncbi:MAG: hypothetical protein PHD32_05585 [Eubacteriales bacterium]|nr:hypothetical protein [Eubacteriales bacterium]
MFYAFLAAFLLFRVWLFFGAALYLQVDLRTKPIFFRLRVSLGVLRLGAFTLDEQARKKMALEVCGIPVRLGKKGVEKKKRPRPWQKKAELLARKLIPAGIRAACRLYARCRVSDICAAAEIGLADDAGATAVVCGSLTVTLGALAQHMDDPRRLEAVSVQPCFGQDRFWLTFSCIVSLKLRHIIIETFKLAKEAFQWARILSRTSWTRP